MKLRFIYCDIDNLQTLIWIVFANMVIAGTIIKGIYDLRSLENLTRLGAIKA
jgi:hypothetical protein